MEFDDFRKRRDDGFEVYCYEVYPELSKAYKEAVKQVPDNLGTIEATLESLTVHYTRIKEIESMMDMFLDIAEYKKLPKRDEGTTDLDRKKKQRYDVAEERAIRDKTAGLCKAVSKRISVLQSRLKSCRDEYNRTSNSNYGR